MTIIILCLVCTLCLMKQTIQQKAKVGINKGTILMAIKLFLALE